MFKLSHPFEPNLRVYVHRTVCMDTLTQDSKPYVLHGVKCAFHLVHKPLNCPPESMFPAEQFSTTPLRTYRLLTSIAVSKSQWYQQRFCKIFSAKFILLICKLFVKKTTFSLPKGQIIYHTILILANNLFDIYNYLKILSLRRNDKTCVAHYPRNQNVVVLIDNIKLSIGNMPYSREFLVENI